MQLHWIIVTIFLLFLNRVNGQINPVYSQFHFNESILNPAVTGSELYPVYSISYRKQWVGVQSSPNTEMIDLNFRIAKFKFYTPKMMLNKGRIRSKERTGIGASVMHDQNGPIHTTGLRLSYAYHIPFSISSLSLGIALSLSDQRINHQMLNPADPDDMVLLEQQNNIFMVNCDAGIYYYSELYFVGFSVTEIIPAWVKEDDPGYRYAPGLNLQGGYRFTVIQNILFEPSVRIRKILTEEVLAELNAKFYFGAANWAGLNLRTDRVLSAYLGINLSRYIYLAYIYEYSFGKIGSHFNNTHTIMLGRNIGVRSISELRKIKRW